MADNVTFTIDARSITAPAGTTILEAAKDANILIPNLCHNEELAPYGACRMCMVETTHKKRTKLVVSCIAEVSEGLEVKTDTERVRNVRTLVMNLLLARNGIFYFCSTIINKGQWSQLREPWFFPHRSYRLASAVLHGLAILHKVELILTGCEYAAVGNDFVFVIAPDGIQSSKAGHFCRDHSFIGDY